MSCTFFSYKQSIYSTFETDKIQVPLLASCFSKYIPQEVKAHSQRLQRQYFQNWCSQLLDSLWGTSMHFIPSFEFWKILWKWFYIIFVSVCFFVCVSWNLARNFILIVLRLVDDWIGLGCEVVKEVSKGCSSFHCCLSHHFWLVHRLPGTPSRSQISF